MNSSIRKQAKSAVDLQQIALREIRRHHGCETVQTLIVSPIIDDRADCNWSIAVSDLGSADSYLARRVALTVHEKLSTQYDLIVDFLHGSRSLTAEDKTTHSFIVHETEVQNQRDALGMRAKAGECRLLAANAQGERRQSC